ncbi:MAG: RNA polymerase sigma factor [Bacteroidota bacterium]
MDERKDGFLELLSRYQGILHKVNLVYFSGRADREDNLQEIIYNLWKAFPNLKNRENPGSWIYSVAINTSISRLRKKNKLDFREKMPDLPDDLDIAGRMADDEALGLLLEGIRRLDEIDRTIMLLYLEERSYEEIALITGITRNNVGVRINRAKDALKKIVKF